MNLSLSARDQVIAVALGTIAILFLFGFLVLKPQFGQLAALKEEQGVEQAKLAEAKLKLQRLDAIRREAVEIEAKRILLARRMPGETELPSLIIELQKTANAADVDLSSLEIGALTASSGYSEIPLKLSVTGDFYSVVDFFYRLEKMTREIMVGDFSISVGGYPKLSVGMSAKAFKFDNPVPQPSASATGTPAAAPTGQPVSTGQ